MEEAQRMETIRQIFPVRIRDMLSGGGWQSGLEEIRVRVGRPVELIYDSGIRHLAVRDGTGTEECVRAGVREISEMLNYISSYSLYAYREELKQGFITIEGGHRVGLAGAAVLSGGKLIGIGPVTFLNIRVARECPDCAKEAAAYLWEASGICSTLIFSAPGNGKTTLLRDCIRQISGGICGHPGLKVGVVDERSELAACHLGVPQNDLGPRTDVLDGCGKPEGMRMLLRTMSPQVIAVDELGAEEDFQAVEQAAYAGCRVIGTLHAGSPEELLENPHLRGWMERRLFQRYVWIRRETDGTRRFTVYGPKMEKIC